MRRIAVTVSASATVAALLACNALTGAGELEAVDCLDACDASLAERTDSPDSTAPGDASPAVDAAPPPPPVDAGADAPTRPSYCEGIALYLPMDGSLAAKSGQPADAPPAVSFVAGKFGQGADLTAPGGVAVFYAATYQSKPVYSLVQGSVAMWVKPTWQPPCGAPAILFKPRAIRAATAPNAGPVVECSATTGLNVDQADAGTVSAAFSGAVPGWKAGDWNHVVGTWTNIANASALRFSVNGGAPVVTNGAWVPNESPVNYLRVGSDVSAPRSVFDEVIVWTRVLATAEIAALAASTVSAAVACGL